MTLFDILTRKIPRHHWVRLTAGTHIEPGHHWRYANLIRRDTLTVNGVGLVLTRMPTRKEPPCAP
jgi:hypothetical protein